jgi:hypothetical protein
MRQRREEYATASSGTLLLRVKCRRVRLPVRCLIWIDLSGVRHCVLVLALRARLLCDVCGLRFYAICVAKRALEGVGAGKGKVDYMC